MKKIIIMVITVLLVLLYMTVSNSNSTENNSKITSPKETSTSGSEVISLVLNEQINWYVLSNGGGKGSSSSFMVDATLSQTSVGTSSSANFLLGHGFWGIFGNEAIGCCNVRGDVAIPTDGNILVDDLVFLVDFLFKGGTSPNCLDAGDVAIPIDGNVLVNDLVFLVDFLFKGGASPPPC